MVLIASAFRLRPFVTLILLVIFLFVLFDASRAWSGKPSSLKQATWNALSSVQQGGDEPQVGQDSSDHGSWSANSSTVKGPSAPWHPIYNAEDSSHPIHKLMQDAWFIHEDLDSRKSRTFSAAAELYRTRHGRHPPPGFKHWYKFARKRHVHNIDDFDQINDDLRPFWAVPPAVIRNHAAHSVDDPSYGNSILAVRNGHVYLPNEHWRPEQFIKLLRVVAKYLPDMDIPLNNLDQPRVIVPWEELQRMLNVEESSRSLSETGVDDTFTKGMSNYWVPSAAVPDRSWVHWFGIDRFYNELAVPAAGNDPAPDYGWENHAGQQYMDLCAKGCPAESLTFKHDPDFTDRLSGYREGLFVANTNRSSDICTVGNLVSDKHGMMYASTSMLSTSKLVPIFSECKVSVNNDILYPANMYYKQDPRYEYTDSADVPWDQKEDLLLWRGVTAGGLTRADEGDKWKQMHRQRFVLLTNSTALGDYDAPVLALYSAKGDYEYYQKSWMRLAPFAEKYMDTGFTEKQACVPNCDFYDSAIEMVKQMSFAETFRAKYLVDIDGMSFSGRWRAFLQSRSLGIKSTIFREWHDSRLFAWKHFVPMDHTYSDLYSLLAYFIGIDQDEPGFQHIKVARHDAAAHAIASEGRQWAAKVLRREDIEIYTYRLLLEYGRIIDDNRNNIGVADDGGQEMRDFDKRYPAMP